MLRASSSRPATSLGSASPAPGAAPAPVAAVPVPRLISHLSSRASSFVAPGALQRPRGTIITRSTNNDNDEGPSTSRPKASQPNGHNTDIDSLKQKYFPDSAPVAEQSAPVAEQPGTVPSSTEFGLDALDAVNPISLGRQARKIIDDQGVAVDNVNPIALGRQARRAFDTVWTQLSQLAAPTKRSVFTDEMELESMGERSQAAETTVLLLGATGRVGRILTRKLLLRGYKVRALVRRKPERAQGADGSPAQVEGVPAAVKVVFGDVGEMRDCQQAVRGVSKVIYCAAARSTFTGELSRVEELGVRNMVKAFQDECMRQSERSRARDAGAAGKQRMFTDKSKKEIADFSRPYHQSRWNIVFVGVSDEDKANQSERAKEMAKYNQAVAEINEDNNLIFEGVLYQKGAVAEVGAKLSAILSGGEHRTASTEGLVLRLRGDGKQYACVLRTKDGKKYSARFATRSGFTHVRLPWDTFRSDTSDPSPLQPDNISYIGLRYDFKRPTTRASRGVPTAAEMEEMKKERMFQLEVDWIKALPGGVEPDFILVSRASSQAVSQLLSKGEAETASSSSSTASQPATAAASAMPLLPLLRPGKAAETGPAPAAPALGMVTRAGVPGASSEVVKVVEFKRRGEDTLRLSGLGYTIIRPGPLVEEPGGYKALVFDQGDRITESIAAADVADICLRALHEPAARNKTFDVCYEDQSEAGSDMYELIAHVPDRSNSYLKAAVASLVKNT